MARRTVEQPEVITGRSGLKIPNLEADLWHGRLWARSPLIFFHSLWKANGLDPSTEYEGSYQRGPRPYSHELVVPADAEKPLTVIRGSFVPRDSQAIARDSDYNDRRWAEYERPQTTTGSEVHTIAVPPTELSPMAVRWSVEHIHTTGGYSNGWSNWDGPAFKRIYPGTSEEIDFRRLDSYSQADDHLTPAERETAAADDYSQTLRAALQAMVDFLSE
jgi:hypothetical protein